MRLRNSKGRFSGHSKIHKKCPVCNEDFEVQYCNKDRIKCCSLRCSKMFRKGKRPNREYSWSNVDTDFLKNNFIRMSYSEIAKALNKTQSSIIHKASRLKLLKKATSKYKQMVSESKFCEYCHEEFSRGKMSYKQFYEKKFCSPECQSSAIRGIPTGRVPRSAFTKGHVPMNKGGWKNILTDEHFEKFVRENKERVGKLWQNPTYQSKQQKSRNLKPNNFERSFYNEMLLRLANKGVIIHYNGNFQKFVGGKNPDFMLYDYRTGKNLRKVIELWGDFYHSPKWDANPVRSNPQSRIEHFKKYGYTCLVIWESEWKKKHDEVIRRVLEFAK